MVTKPRIGHALALILMLAASSAFPVGTRAQAAPTSTKSAPLSAAMAEVRRSPFFATSSVEGLSVVEMTGVPGHDVGDRLDPDSTKGPSFRRVFWPTLGGAVLSEITFVGLLMGDAPNLFGGVLGIGVLVGGPAAVARIMGARFTAGLLGSALGAGLGYGLFRLGIAVGLDDSSAYWAIPTTHALLTTVISIG